MFTECAANLDNIQTIPKTQLGDLIAVLSMARMEDVHQGIAFSLGINEYV
jgi:mRNA-degrading endonuclease toxin of MazEF toxin-antitoxin module